MNIQSTKKHLILVFTTMLAIVFLAACGGKEEVLITVPEGAQAGDVFLAPCEVYLEGDDRHYPGECGTLAVRVKS